MNEFDSSKMLSGLCGIHSDSPVAESPPLDQGLPTSQMGSQENLPAMAMTSQQFQQQQQQRVIQVESGMVMDQFQQGIYQNPKNGAIKHSSISKVG